MTKPPIREITLEAITLAKQLITDVRFAAIAVLRPETNTPFVTRIAMTTTQDGALLTLISDLSFHTKALRENPECGLLIGEPKEKGDPLTHPRLSLQATARFVKRDATLRNHYLDKHPKSKLYIDFADFYFVTFDIHTADLNGGFGQAFALNKEDLT